MLLLAVPGLWIVVTSKGWRLVSVFAFIAVLGLVMGWFADTYLPCDGYGAAMRTVWNLRCGE